MDLFGRDLALLALALLLSALIGLEREFKLKSAGLRTHAMVGFGTAILTLVSKWGFADSIAANVHVSYDPSRIAAQVVTGIGFIGAGLIFVRQDIVHGLTTAATIWVTAGIGMAAAAGLPALALLGTAGHFIVFLGFTPVMRHFLDSTNLLHVRYKAGFDAASAILERAARHGFVVRNFTLGDGGTDPEMRSVILQLSGTKSMAKLAEEVIQVTGVLSASYKPGADD